MSLATGIPRPLQPIDTPTPDVICDELAEMDMVSFERSWPALVLDLVIRDEASVSELALLLRIVRERYRGKGGSYAAELRRRAGLASCREYLHAKALLDGPPVRVDSGARIGAGGVKNGGAPSAGKPTMSERHLTKQ